MAAPTSQRSARRWRPDGRSCGQASPATHLDGHPEASDAKLLRRPWPGGCVAATTSARTRRRSLGINHLVLGDPTATTSDGEKVRLGPGDLVFCDPARPRSLRFTDGCRMTVLRLPRRHLALSETDLDRVTGMTVRGGEGLGALVSDLLITLATEAETHGTRVIGQLTRSAADLLVALVMEVLQTEAEADASTAESPGSELLHRIKAYIEEHLTDTDLSPQSVARANCISVRYLH
ncbi:AraC-like ligand-binding domain-containing protein [Streptomyces sp. NPDC001732]